MFYVLESVKMFSPKSLLVLTFYLSLALAWPWSDYELEKANQSDLAKYAERILIKNEMGETKLL